MTGLKSEYFNRDLSWLTFNLRVLQESRNLKLPLYERIKFLSIYSSNLDEFFRVRYPAHVALERLATEVPESSKDEESTLKSIRKTVDQQQSLFGEIFRKDILSNLLNENIHLYYNEPLDPFHRAFVKEYFFAKALSFLQPIVLLLAKQKVVLRNNHLYFLSELSNGGEVYYAILNIPHEELQRFITLPTKGEERQIIFLDDVIRENIDHVYPGFKVNKTFSVKMTRSADVNLLDEWSDLLEEQIIAMLEARELGIPSRFLYEAGMPDEVQAFIKDYFQLTEAEMIEGGRYHNLKDLISLPNPDGGRLKLNLPESLPQKTLDGFESIFDAIKDSDHLLHFPYQSYNYVLRFFNEAAIDPHVEGIFVTLYRVAANSHIVNALISAAKKGKEVVAFIELKARFDEENNLNWAKKMKRAGVKIVYSIPNLKVHSKLALVKKKVGWKSAYYALMSTGNFNESTAKFYTDHLLLTSHAGITKEIDLLFAYLLSREQPQDYQFLNFDHLLVARFNFLKRFEELVEREISIANSGKKAEIVIKINNLEEKNIINLLYRASAQGVKIMLIVRGICCLVPEKKGLSENITVHRIVDGYLEHGRVFIFNNDGQPEVFMGSADLMNRNLHRRIEVVFPVYEPQLKNEMIELIKIQLQDNVQAVKLDEEGNMQPVSQNSEVQVQSQKEIYKYLLSKLGVVSAL